MSCSRCKALEAELASLRAENETLQQQVELVPGMAIGLSVQARENHRLKQEARQRLEEARDKSVTELEREVKRLEKENADLRDTVKSLSAANSKLTSDVKNLQDAMNSLNVEWSGMRAFQAELVSEKGRLLCGQIAFKYTERLAKLVLGECSESVHCAADILALISDDDGRIGNV